MFSSTIGLCILESADILQSDGGVNFVFDLGKNGKRTCAIPSDSLNDIPAFSGGKLSGESVMLIVLDARSYFSFLLFERFSSFR